MAAEPLKGPGGERASPQDIGLPEIPGYRIEETLGRGATGVVYRATQLAVDRQVALKVLHPELAGRSRAVRRLQREARTAARLAHPNIVSAIDMGQVGPLWWYAMELVEGESLAARVKRMGRLSEREALRLFAPLVDALDHAQRQGVVHRDIKPANILIDTAGRARLVDLGLAFREDDPLITSPGSTLGTPHYVSPEQARNPEAADTRSDIWSLGATLYHAVCGRPPFPGDSVAEILSGVLYGRVTEPRDLEPSLSRGLALILRKCLSRDPARRYATPRELLEDLERCREKRPVQVQPSGLDPVRARGGWRARLPWVAVAGGVLLVGGWLARDVLAPGAAPAPVPGVQAVDEPWPELEQLALAALRPDTPPAPALVQLAALSPVPSRHRPRYEEIEEQLVTRLREAQAAFLRRLGAEVDRLVAQRDFVGALQLLSPEGFAARARAELEIDEAQLDELERGVRPQELRRDVLVELDVHAAELARRVGEQVDQVLQARVDNDVRSGLWREAHQALSREPLRLLADAGLVTAGLPPERLEELLARLRGGLAERRARLEARWRELDLGLAAELVEEAARLEQDLRARIQTRSAVDALAQFHEQRCRELKLVPGQRLDEVSAEATLALERLSGELVVLERSLVQEDARGWLADAQAQAAPLRGQRRYGELAELWRRALESEWLTPVHAEVELELRAAQLVQDLLERAARGVLERDGQTLGLLVRSIEVSGRLAAGSAPLERGFGLVAPDVGTVALALRPLEAQGGARPYVLPPEAVERFAGLPSDPARSRAPEDLLARALLRHGEGDIAGALACLPFPHSGDPLLDALGARLQELVSRRDGELREQRQRRLEEAEVRVHVALRVAAEARHAGDRETAVQAIDELFASYGDLEPVRRREDELRRLRADLAPGRSPEADDFREAFGPTSIELEGGLVRLGFDFGPAYEGRWSRGAWREDADGWIARGPHSLDDVLGATGWPRLVLGPPLDLDGPLEVAFTFEQPQDSGQPRLLVASVAGVHVVLRGEQGFEPARLAMGAGGPDELRRLVQAVDREGKGRGFAGLVRGERYTLGVLLSRQRGKAVVRLWGRAPSGEDFDGRELEQLLAPRPEGKPGTTSLVLRSIEPLRLLEATVRGRAVESY